MKRRFEVKIETYATIELDEAVIEAVDDEWRSMFYNLRAPEDIAGMIARNLIFNKWPLSQLDGWTNLPDEFARIVEIEHEDARVEDLTIADMNIFDHER